MNALQDQRRQAMMATLKSVGALKGRRVGHKVALRCTYGGPGLMHSLSAYLPARGGEQPSCTSLQLIYKSTVLPYPTLIQMPKDILIELKLLYKTR